MTRAFAAIALACAALRLVGHIAVAISNEINEALSEYRVEIPEYVPAWLDVEE